MSNVPGLFVLGEANFSDHGANRLGASALMQGLADGYFVLPYTIGGYLAGTEKGLISESDSAFVETEKEVQSRIDKLLSINGKRTVDDFHRRLGLIMWDYCGMARNNAGLEKARGMIQELRAEFWDDVLVPGGGKDFNQSLEKAGRVADFLASTKTFKPKRMKPNGTMKTSAMWPPGSIKARERPLISTRKS